MEIVNVHNKRLQAQHSYDFKYGVGGFVPASGGDFFNITISADADFECHSITGFYTTQTAGPVDGGANTLSMQIQESGRDLKLFNDLIPLSVFFSPGRQRASLVAGDPSNQLFFPIEFNYLFKSKADIQIEVRNTADLQNYFFICFHGTKYLINPAEF